MRARVVAVATPKGGCGKTTLAVHLADWLARSGERVQLWDLDPQGSAAAWAAHGAFSWACKQPTSWEALKQPRDCSEWWVLDCPPALTEVQSAQLAAAFDLLLAPVLPSPLDLWAAADWFERLAALGAAPAARMIFVLNQSEAKSLDRALYAVARELGARIARQSVGRRSVFRRAALKGASVFALGRSAEAAQRELKQLFQEVLEYEAGN